MLTLMASLIIYKNVIEKFTLPPNRSDTAKKAHILGGELTRRRLAKHVRLVTVYTFV